MKFFTSQVIYNTIIMTTKSRHRGTMSIIGYNFKASAQFIEQTGIKYQTHSSQCNLLFFRQHQELVVIFQGSSDFRIR